MRITRQAVTRRRARARSASGRCSIGERAVRYSPDGEDFVDVCPLCQDAALEHGWLKEGSPTTPVVARPAAQAARPARGALRVAQARGRAGRRRADPPPPVRAGAGDGRGRRPLQRAARSAARSRDREEPRRAEASDRAALRREHRGRRDRRLGHLLVPVPRHAGLGASRCGSPSAATSPASSRACSRSWNAQLSDDGRIVRHRRNLTPPSSVRRPAPLPTIRSR